MIRTSGSRARLRLAIGAGGRPGTLLDLRIQCWLRRVARAIERRDSPHDPPPRPAVPPAGHDAP